MLILKRKELVTINILYYRPDYRNILNSFIWQTDDEIPEYPRVHNFLGFWKKNIDAVISEILISEGFSNNYRRIDWEIQ